MIDPRKDDSAQTFIDSDSQDSLAGTTVAARRGDPTEPAVPAALAGDTRTEPVLERTAETDLRDITVETPVAGKTPTDPVVRNEGLALAPGTMLGDYRIERQVAEGGWGTVFSAVHPLIGKRVAVKVLKKELCLHPASVQRFIDEARAVNRIGHPNIVDVFTFGETLGGRSYFMMEWLQGMTLAARRQQGPMELDDIAAIITQLALALEAAHDKGVVHRDLKPDNVYLMPVRGERPRVKLLDFGIAKLATNDTRPKRTSAGEIVGTPAYMAPEQARGRQVDQRVDVYALGALLFELLTGRVPFDSDNAADIIAQLLTQPAPRVSTFVPDISPVLDDLVASMLAKDPNARPSLPEVRAAITSRAASQPARGRGAAPMAVARDKLRNVLAHASRAGTEMMRSGSSRTRWLVAAAVAATAALAIVAWLALRPGPAAKPAVGDPASKLVLSVSGAASYDVVIDNVWVTPGPDGEIPVGPGIHAVEVRAPGMRPESFEMRATPGGVLRKNVTLQRAR